MHTSTGDKLHTKYKSFEQKFFTNLRDSDLTSDITDMIIKAGLWNYIKLKKDRE